MADDNHDETPGIARERAAFKACLRAFDPDEDKAAAKYELMRGKLIKYFRNRRTRFPEEDTDTTLDRFCKKVLEGEDIRDVSAYCLRVAGFVYLECLRDAGRRPRTDADEVIDIPDPSDRDGDSDCLACLNGCLARLPADHRELILAYYSGERREKIEGRKRLAILLGISVNTLRLRAFRLRDVLSVCVRSCLETGPGIAER